MAGMTVGFLIFAGIIPGFKGGGSSANAVKLAMWGTFPQSEIGNLISRLNNENKNLFSISYSEKKPENYRSELLNAMAAGNPPDIWFLTEDMVLDFKDKIYQIPFESFSERKFKDSFIDIGDIFLDSQKKKIIALPFLVDPMVLYWNKDLFSYFGLSRPPRFWDEFLSSSAILTVFDESGDIIQSGAALGEFKNVKNAKDILLMMIFQTGNPIIRGNSKDNFKIVWNEKNSAENSLKFFNEFSNSKKNSYSWNRSEDNSDNMFAAGSLAMYFGYAGEFNDIKIKNPHLYFDVAEVPQIKGGDIRATIGKIYSLAISKTSPDTQAAFWAIFKLTDRNFNKQFSETARLAPVRRDIISEEGNEDLILSVFYKSAIMAKSWLAPDQRAVSGIFQNMIESTVSGKAKISEAIKNAEAQMEELLK